MATLYTQQDSNRFKTVLLMTGFLVAVIAIGYAAAWYLNNPSIIYIAVIFALGMNVLVIGFQTSWYSV